MSKGIWATLGLILIACGGKNAGETVRPVDPTVAHARGDEGQPAVCHEPTAEGTPLIVDWKPEERGDLEGAMKEGVAVVHYDCKTLKVLPDCHPPGKYAFLGTTKREQLISLENADDAQANLPLHGASIGGGLSRGSAINVGLIMIGKTTTPVDGVTTATLGAHCEGATHFVQSTTVGAFAMKSATAGDVHIKAAVDVFGASADSSSQKTMSNKDGDPDSCNGADIDAPKPPGGCGAPLRVRLLAIGAPPPSKEDQAKDVTCQDGLTVVNGKCTAKVKTEAAAGTKVKRTDCGLDETPQVCEQACNDGVSGCCATLAVFYMLGQDVKQDDAMKDKYWGKACALGDLMSCDAYGSSLKQSDPAQATALFKKACDGGVPDGCTDLGSILADKDKKGSVRAFMRACSGGRAYGCVMAAEGYETGGPGFPANPAKATELYELSCMPGDNAGESCYKAGLGYKATDKKRAKMYLGWACNSKAGYPIACAALKKMK